MTKEFLCDLVACLAACRNSRRIAEAIESWQKDHDVVPLPVSTSLDA